MFILHYVNWHKNELICVTPLFFMWGWSREIFGSSLHQQNLEWVELWCRKENRMWLLPVFYTIFSLVYSFVSCLAFYISLRSSQNGSVNSSEWKTKMSQSEDSIKERQNFSKSSSEESMFEDETMCSTHQLHSREWLSLFSVSADLLFKSNNPVP